MKTKQINFDELGREYLKQDGNLCPFCGSNDLNCGRIEVDSNYAWQDVRCENCEEDWKDTYTLTGVTFTKIY